jgi:hypothetical protein
MGLTPSQLAELTLLLFAARAESVLQEEDDEPAALRKALLVLAALNQENENVAAKRFARYLLTSFEPLRSRLDHCNHELWDGHTIGIRANEDGEPVVAISHDMVDVLINDFVRESPDVQDEVLQELPDAPGDEVRWPLTEDRFVGFFDVMGFSGMVRDAGDDHGHLYAVMLGLHEIARLAEKLFARGDQYRQVLSRSSTFSGQLKAVQFSDSIVVFTADASSASSLLIQMASQMFFLHALRHGVIVRGAIARGSVTTDFTHSIFFGQAIVDAYRLEEAQQWFGIAIHPSAEQSVPEDVAELGNDEIPLVETFEVTLRGQEAAKPISVINWPVIVDRRENLAKLLRPFNGSKSREPDKLRAYHDRTLVFAQAMWRKYRGTHRGTTSR